MHKHTNLIHICMTMSGKVSEKVGYRRHQNSQRGQAKIASSFSSAPASASPAAADGLEPSGTEAKRLHHVVSRFGQWYGVVDGQRAERRGPGQACSYRRAHDV